MRSVCVLLAVTTASATVATGQVVSEWRTARGLPVAVVEVAGGDVEHFAALLPADAATPNTVAGFSTEVRPRRFSQLWSVAVPSLAAQSALTEFIAALSASGAAALVALGPVPAREIQAQSAAIDALAARLPPRPPCVLAEGAVEGRRGDPDSVELAISLPQPDDPRSDLSPGLVSWVRTRLASSFPDARVAAESQDGCSRLVVRVASHGEHPRIVLRRLRQTLAQIPAAAVSGDELARAIAACQNRADQAAVSGASVAREIAERLALGGSATRAFATPWIDGTTMADLARHVLAGHPGSATLVEQERRPQAEPGRTLENGVELTVMWIPGETGVVALALGGFAPRSGHEILAVAAESAARSGWQATVDEIAGVPTLAVAVPAASVADALERVSEGVSSARPVARDDLEAEASRALGLTESLTAETLSIALALPPEADAGAEATEKFFGSFPSGRVSAGVAPVGPGLKWTVGEGVPGVLGIAELPPSEMGLVGWQLLHERLATEGGIRVTALAPPGRLLLAVASEGLENVPALDGHLATVWRAAVRPASTAEVAAAAHRTLAALFGDAAQATARAAAAAFLPKVPTQADLLGIDAAQLNKVLAALPAWEKMSRFARGAPPPPPAPPSRKRGVRKSPSPQRREP